jgi:hypothetical protein
MDSDVLQTLSDMGADERLDGEWSAAEARHRCTLYAALIDELLSGERYSIKDNETGEWF